MSFSISPRLRGYDELFSQMLAAVPPGNFYDVTLGIPIVMWSKEPSAFVLTSDNPGYPVRIRVERLGDYGQGVDNGNLRVEATVVPQVGSIQTLFYLTLGRGRNRLTAEEMLPNGGGRKKTIEIIATTNTLIYESYGREISKAVLKAQVQKQAIFSSYSTRLLDQISGFGDVLPDLQTLKTLSTKMLVRAYVHYPATEIGIRNSIEAVSLNTPVFVSQTQPSSFDLENDSIMRVMENAAGKEAHTWFPNLAVTRWLAFVKMANNFRNLYEFESVRDDLVRLYYKGLLQEHTFDYDGFGQNFLNNLSLSDCFANIQVTAFTGILTNIRICCWTYPFDTFIRAGNNIGLTRPYLDSGVPFDSGIPFDADPVDPFSDGFLGFTYSGRFEMDDPPTPHPLDSMVQPALTWAGPACSYEGPYTQMLNSIRSDIPLDTETEVLEWTVDDYVPGAIVGLGISYPNTDVGIVLNDRVFKAGEPILLCVKYVDANGMTNPTGTGIIRIEEPVSGIDEWAPVPVVNNGFIYIYFTPELAINSTQFLLTDGALTGESDFFQVIPADFDYLTVTAIGAQTAGVPFNVTVQAKDVYGNDVTDVGLNTQFAILPQGGLDAGDPTPNLQSLVNGTATFNLTCNQPGTGQLRFQLGSIFVDSNVFTVS